ncbi:MAG: SAM-dependent methyltransferase [Myxococcota bacterium]|jgi:SAM-dependent methyltransferase
MLTPHPSVQRNRDPIAKVIQGVLPGEGLVLEIGSGSGAHAAWFAPRLPGVSWQPTDGEPASLPIISQWAAQSGATNILPPLHLDATAQDWPVERAAAMVCINMIHISPWQVTLGLLAGAGRVLPSGGVLYLYGPFRINGQQTAPSNVQFEGWLKGLDPRFGVRDLGEVTEVAAGHGLRLTERRAMPANNFSVVFQRD